MLHVLRAVQIAEIKGEARRISFRDIDVEQIGYMYEGLLGYTATVAPEVVLGILGTRGEEPEIPLAKLEELAATNSDRKKLAKAIRAWIETDQPSAKPSSEAAIAKAIDSAVDPALSAPSPQAVGDDLNLRERVKPWLGSCDSTCATDRSSSSKARSWSRRRRRGRTPERTTRQSRSPKTSSSTHSSRSCTPRSAPDGESG
jgi:hypothetical protein